MLEKKHHVIKLIATTDKKVEASPDASTLEIITNDTISFKSDHGDVLVEFEPDDIFSAASFDSKTKDLTAVKTGAFKGHCSLTLHGSGELIGWKKDKTSGSNGQVVDGNGSSRGTVNSD